MERYYLCSWSKMIKMTTIERVYLNREGSADAVGYFEMRRPQHGEAVYSMHLDPALADRIFRQPRIARDPAIPLTSRTKHEILMHAARAHGVKGLLIEI
jgi:hypothetical protein